MVPFEIALSEEPIYLAPDDKLIQMHRHPELPTNEGRVPAT